jgi:CubicO group peptidase (beta-lactamase class C family)
MGQLACSAPIRKWIDGWYVVGHHRPMAEGFPEVRAAFDGNLASGEDVGASFCVTVDGETVVDLWGGFADEGRTRPWRDDTIVGVYSTTKTMTALTALLVADRGELDFDAPVARYWPEFAAGGKEGVTVAQLMSHSAGLCGWREPITRNDLYDWEKATALLAAQEPFWTPGTMSGYHAMTQGYLVGEVVRRISGRSLGTVFRDEVAAPLGADFHIGLPAPGRGAARRSRRPVVSATRAPWPRSTRFWRTAARSGDGVSCPGPDAGGRWNSRSRASISSWACRCGTAWDSR